MAKQNFVSGGFYGKLGALVGQRWKNKRTVRAYVIPHNPRTEKQQANRRLFGVHTANAQLGMQMNYKAPCFITDNQTEWALRMAQASALYSSGQTNMNLIPLFPKGYTPAYTVTEYSLVARPTTSSVKIKLKGALPTESRSVSVLVAFYDSTVTGYDFELYSAKTEIADETTLTIEGTDAQKYDATTRIMLVSNDDKDHNSKMLYGADSALVVKVKVSREFKFGAPTVENTAITFSAAENRYSMTTVITFEEPFTAGDQTINDIIIKNVKMGNVTVNMFDSVSFIDNNGKFAMQFTVSDENPANIPAYPAGSEITIGKLSIETDTEILTGENITLAISNTDTEREYISTIVATTQSGAVVTLQVAKDLPSAETLQGIVTLREVKAGAFTQKDYGVSSAIGKELSITTEEASGINQIALPTGSSAIISLSIISNGVTYKQSDMSEQSILTSDLTRTFKMADGIRTETSDGYTITFSLVVDEFTAQASVLEQYQVLEPFTNFGYTSEYTREAKRLQNETLQWSITGFSGNCIKNEPYTPPLTYTSNGVTYNCEAVTLGSNDESASKFKVFFSASDYNGSSSIYKMFRGVSSMFQNITGFTTEEFVACYEIEDFTIRNPQLYFNGTDENGNTITGGRFSSIDIGCYTGMGGEIEVGIIYAEYNGAVVDKINNIKGNSAMSTAGEVVLPVQHASSNKYARGLTLRFE